MSTFLPLDDVKTYIRKMKEIPYLESFHGEYLEEMFKASEMREFEAGETIIEEGTWDQALYFLLLGEVRVLKGGVEVATIDRYGEIFGEQAVIAESVRSASVEAVTPCYCLAVDTEFVLKLPLEQRAACYSVIHRICAHVLSDRLKKTTAELARIEQDLKQAKGG